MTDGGAIETVPPGEMANARPHAGRFGAIDISKAIGITLVVFGHVWGGLRDAQILRSERLHHAVYDWVYAFHMPLFFLLAGLFIERSVARSPARVLTIKASTILYPYLIWSVVQTVIQSRLGGIANGAPALSDLPRNILLEPKAQFWFLYILFCVEMIYYGLRRLRIPILAITGGSMVLYFAGQYIPLPLAVAQIVTQFCGSAIFFALGALLSSSIIASLDIASLKTAAAVSMAAAAAVGVLTESRYALVQPIKLLAAICGITMVLALASTLARTAVARALEQLGALSLQIYLAHILFAAGSRIMLVRVFGIHNVPVHVVFDTALGIAGPIALWKVVEYTAAAALFKLPLPRTAAKGAQ